MENNTNAAAGRLGKPKLLFLGLQHTFAMFGATVLVPLLTGLPTDTTLLMAGIGTLLFHLLTNGKVPIFLGSSFAFLAGYATVAPMLGDQPNVAMLPYASGGVVVAGLVYVLFSLLIYKFGVKRVMRVFPPIVVGPIIIAIGLILAPSAIANCQQDWLIAAVALLSIVAFTMWGKGFLRVIPILLGLLLSYLLAIALGRVDFTAIREASWVGLPLHTAYFAKFDVSAIITIAPIAIATIMEHIGDVSAVSATTGKKFIEDPGLHRTILGDGVATAASALFGGPANTTYGENTGVLALTGVHNPLVMRIAAVYAICLSFLPKVSALINTIPVAIIGGISLMLYGMISTVGLRNLVESKVDFAKPRNLVICGVILVSALGFNAIGGITFAIGTVPITLSGLAIASILGIVLNLVLPDPTVEDPVLAAAEGTQKKEEESRAQHKAE